MMKKVSLFFLTGTVALLLCSCNGAKNEHFELENTPWGMTMEETMEAYQVERDDLDDIQEGTYGSAFMLRDGREIFGAKTDHISFNFMDMTVSGKTQKLHRIDVMYPDDTDMNEVRKNMEQSFGKITDNVTDFDMTGTLLDSDMQRYDYEADEHLALWADKKVSDVIPKGQEEEYEKLWEILRHVFQRIRGKNFPKTLLWCMYVSDNADNAPIGDKRIRIDATNWVIYNTIKEELE